MANYNKWVKGILAGLLLLLIACSLLQAQRLDPVSFSVTESPGKVKAGERFEITIRAEITGNWYLYSALNDPDAGPFPTTFTPAGESVLLAGPVTETEAEIKYDPNFDTNLGLHSNNAAFVVPLVAESELLKGSTVAVDILYQACDDISCLPPKTKQVTVPVTISGISENPVKGYDSTEQNQGENFLQEYGPWAAAALLIFLVAVSLNLYFKKQVSDI